MRIVADTNTVLSGLLWQGTPRQILEHARDGVITLYTSVELLTELAEVIGRGKFAQRIQRAGLSASALVEDYRRLAVVVDPPPLPVPVSRDTDDDHVLACALTARAVLIVSGDNDLLVLGAFQQIPILSARATIEAILSSSH